MSVDVISVYQKFKSEFLRIKKRILKKKLSVNPDKLREYQRDIIAAHDNIVNFISSLGELDSREDAYFRAELIYIRDRTIQCFGKLRLNYSVSRVLTAPIDETILISDGSETESDSELITEEMAPITEIDFLRLCGNQINKSYAGDPLALNSFINSVKLLQKVQGDHAALLQQFVLSKLESRALEAIPPNPANVDAILDALSNVIKPDDSKVIEGRMMALRIDKTKVQDFTKQAEDLAEALERSFISKKIPQDQAKQMTIDKTVEMCRNSARSDLVKTVLAATPFKEPKEVIAKFVVEGANELKDKQILAYRQQNRSNNYRGGRNYRNNRDRNDRNWRNRNNNGNYNNNGQKNNYRGRGRYRNNPRNDRNDNQERSIRVAENAGTPPRGWRADQNQPQSSQTLVTYQRD